LSPGFDAADPRSTDLRRMDFERAALEAMTRPSPPNASGELPAKTMSDRRGSRRVGPNRASICRPRQAGGRA